MNGLVPVRTLLPQPVAVPQALVPQQVEHGISVVSKSLGKVVQVRERAVTIKGKVYNLNPHQLIRMIKQITQTIGEYKTMSNLYADYVVGALRKSRGDMCSDLEYHFGINWEIGEKGESVFYI